MRLLLAVPFLVVLVAFALSNQQPVTVGLWPFDGSLQVPLSIAVLVPMGVSFFLGALLLWFSAVSARRQARRAERKALRVDAEASELRRRLDQAVASGPPVRSTTLPPSP
jgi:lipopolysaccharide assembly protein A